MITCSWLKISSRWVEKYVIIDKNSIDRIAFFICFFIYWFVYKLPIQNSFKTNTIPSVLATMDTPEILLTTTPLRSLLLLLFLFLFFFIYLSTANTYRCSFIVQVRFTDIYNFFFLKKANYVRIIRYIIFYDSISSIHRVYVRSVLYSRIEFKESIFWFWTENDLLWIEFKRRICLCFKK